MHNHLHTTWHVYRNSKNTVSGQENLNGIYKCKTFFLKVTQQIGCTVPYSSANELEVRKKFKF